MLKNFKIFLFLIICAISCNEPNSAEFHLKGGTLIDGLGNPAIKADLVIQEGLIQIINPESKVEAEKVIDVTNLIIAPGFIDVHNHSDQSIQENDKKLNEPFIRQGVTTIVGSPDGFLSPSEIRKLIDKYEEQGIGTNVAFYVGHNGIRAEVLKDDQQREPTPEELDRMKQLVKEGMEMGAVGLSTGLMYPGGLYSNTEEVIELAKVVTPYSGIYDSHVRNPVHALVKSDLELIEISNKAGIAGKIGHLKAVGLQNAGKISEIINMVDSARMEGIEIVSDQYPYDGAQTSILEEVIVIPSEMKENEQVLELIRNDSLEYAISIIKSLLKDESTRSKIRLTSENGDKGGFAWLVATGYSSIRITSTNDFPEYIGKYLSEIAEEMGLEPFEAVCKLIIDANERVNVSLGGIFEQDVQTLLVQPWNMIASDGAYAVESDEPFGHPRGTGTFPRVLGHYVRRLKLLSLEEAIRKMTSFPASFIGLNRRGRIEDGLPADLVVFNPNSIIDNSTYEYPNRYASGVIHVFVNGIPVLLDNEMTGRAPGKYLKRGD